jgi:hypothetical protein
MSNLKPISAMLWPLGRNVLAFAVSVIIVFGATDVSRILGSSVPFQLVASLAFLAAMALTLRLHALPVAFMVVADGAWRLTIFLIRNVYGTRWARPEAIFAAMVAGFVGVIFGAALMRWAGPAQHWLTRVMRPPARRRATEPSGDCELRKGCTTKFSGIAA